MNATEYLSEQWGLLSNDQVWKDWAIGKISSLFVYHSVIDNTPLLNFLTDQLNQFDSIKRRFTLSAIDVENGEYVHFDQTNIDVTEVPKAAVASASIPLVFPPFNWEGRGIYMDGMAAYNVDL